MAAADIVVTGTPPDPRLIGSSPIPGPAGIDSTCNVSNNAHEHHEWPLYPIPKHEGMDMKTLLEMKVLLQDGNGQMASAQKSVRTRRVWLQSTILSRQMPARMRQLVTSGRPGISGHRSPRL